MTDTNRSPYYQQTTQGQNEFIINTLINRSVNTAILCQVINVIPQSENSLDIVYVDIKPLVTQLTASGETIEHSTINNVPVIRWQGGGNSIIINPIIGDIGLAIIASNDISGVKSSKKQSPPTSLRKFDYADSIYLGGLLNAIPTNYINLHDGIIDIKTTTLNITGNVIITGNVTNNGKNISNTHTHSGVQTGSGNTGQVN